MKIPNQCPMCGSRSWKCINVYHSGYSFEKSLIGSIFFGKRIGGLFGFTGKKRRTYACRDCHFMMDYQK